MPRQLQLDIKETSKQLESQLKTARTASQKERLQMLWWLKTGQVTGHQQLAQRLGRDPSTVTRWLQRYRQGGFAALPEVKVAPGQTRQLTPEAIPDQAGRRSDWHIEVRKLSCAVALSDLSLEQAQASRAGVLQCIQGRC